MAAAATSYPRQLREPGAELLSRGCRSDAARRARSARSFLVLATKLVLQGRVIEEVAEASAETEVTEAGLLVELREIRSRLDRLETRLGR